MSDLNLEKYIQKAQQEKEKQLRDQQQLTEARKLAELHQKEIAKRKRTEDAAFFMKTSEVAAHLIRKGIGFDITGLPGRKYEITRVTTRAISIGAHQKPGGTGPLFPGLIERRRRNYISKNLLAYRGEMVGLWDLKTTRDHEISSVECGTWSNFVTQRALLLGADGNTYGCQAESDSRKDSPPMSFYVDGIGEFAGVEVEKPSEEALIGLGRIIVAHNLPIDT